MLEDTNGKKMIPSWLELLLATKFFGACAEHQGIKKKIERNIYCVDCNESMCSFCFSSPSCSHRHHRMLQIRRYIYQNVIRIRDMQKLIDCSEVQVIRRIFPTCCQSRVFFRGFVSLIDGNSETILMDHAALHCEWSKSSPPEP